MAFVDTDALAALSPAALSDDALMAVQRSLASGLNDMQAASASVAAEISVRSARELGYGGLAAQQGLRSGAELVQKLTGSSLGDARKLVRVGTVLATDAEQEPWLAPALSTPVGALDAIRTGLGAPTSVISADDLATAARSLASMAPSLDVDALARLAREARAELDLSEVPLREEELRDLRDATITRMRNGNTKLVAILDPESAAKVVGPIDAITAPRRGGPRFVEEGGPKPQKLDNRTTGQLILDAIVDIFSVAVKAPSGKLFSKKQPGVRVLVTLNDLNSGEGFATIEGQSGPVSIETARRYACDAGILPVAFDKNGQGMDLGRDERYHDTRQRNVASARDGGCRIVGCPCPPAWCEMHHIIPWGEGGDTSVEDGVLLCRFHHMLMHNLGGRIVREGSAYYLIPPKSMDPRQVPVPLPSKSPALRRLLAAG